MTNDHPVNVAYDDGSGEMVASPVGITLDTADKIQCYSCHDVHNAGSVADGTAPFLAKSNTSSALCESCHAK